MASLRKSPQASPESAVAAVDAAIAAALAEHVVHRARVAVALSGGMDSMVLLDAAAAFVARHPIALSAIHVDHGLSPNASRWAEFCAAQCVLRDVPLATHRLRLDRPRGASLAARARSARFGRPLPGGVRTTIFAHQAAAPAETGVLPLLRGARPQG